MTDQIQTASPAEAAIMASGLAVDVREMPTLIRRVERLLPDASPGRIREALIETRRKGWAGRMNALASKQGMAWARTADARAAAAAIAEPEPTDDALLASLEETVAARLRAASDTASQALEIVASDIADTAGTPLSPERHAALAAAVARAFALPDAGDFVAAAERDALLRREA
ncbi:MAG TPA: RNA helicase, partial [Acetobacteraceae bacterium]|nr:RNA helicase [Acetobacteraceae bacterium]